MNCPKIVNNCSYICPMISYEIYLPKMGFAFCHVLFLMTLNHISLTNIHYFSVSMCFSLRFTYNIAVLCAIISSFSLTWPFSSSLAHELGQNWTFITLCKYSVMIGSSFHICINEASPMQQVRGLKMQFVLCFRPKRNTRRASMSSASARRSTWRTWRWCLSSASGLRRTGWTSSGKCFWISNAILTSPRAKGQLQITDLLSKTWWSEVQSF